MLDALPFSGYSFTMNTEYLRTRRKELGLSITEAARRAGWLPGRWHDYESGLRPVSTLGTLDKLADVLQIEQLELLRKLTENLSQNVP